MGDPMSTIPALPPRPPQAASSPASSLLPTPMTVAASTSEVPVVDCGAASAPAAIVGATPAPASVLDAGAGAVHIVFAAAAATTAAHREAIREEERRKKSQRLGLESSYVAGCSYNSGLHSSQDQLARQIL
ncbi:unnamed protein product [Urochloa humidicola]